MPGRAIWRGVISFGMVSIPIRLYTAAQSKDIAFRQLHRDDKVRIRQRRWCPEHDAEVPSDEIAKGYEFAKDQYVILEDDDFENLPVASQHTIALTNFVPLEQIEPASFEKTYYLEPEETGTKPFALLIRAAFALRPAFGAGRRPDIVGGAQGPVIGPGGAATRRARGGPPLRLRHLRRRDPRRGVRGRRRHRLGQWHLLAR